jgi:hypothetical protein
LAGEHAGRLGDQRLPQLELLGGELDVLAVDAEVACPVVDGERADLADGRGLGLVDAAEQGADAAAELGVGERLWG